MDHCGSRKPAGVQQVSARVRYRHHGPDPPHRCGTGSERLERIRKDSRGASGDPFLSERAAAEFLSDRDNGGRQALCDAAWLGRSVRADLDLRKAGPQDGPGTGGRISAVSKDCEGLCKLSGAVLQIPGRLPGGAGACGSYFRDCGGQAAAGVL